MTSPDSPAPPRPHHLRTALAVALVVSVHHFIHGRIGIVQHRPEHVDHEGRYLLRLHAYRERNPSLRRKKISSVLADGGSLACEVCTFDFAQQYGERGQGYTECHHVEPLHVGGEKARSVKDLALLCSNCHRIIHTKPLWPTPAELRNLIRRQPDRS